MNINPKPNYQIAPAFQGQNKTILTPESATTRGSGAATIAIPTRRERIIRVEINSNDRDFTKYPNPAEFQWIAPFPIQGIKSMTIVGGTVPVPIYTIDVPYNSFSFDTGTAIKTVTFPPGLYTPLFISQVLAPLLTAADGTNTYTVNVDKVTQLLTVKTSGTNNFGFLFGPGANDTYRNKFYPGLSAKKNPAYMLGFNLNGSTYADPTTHILTAPHAVNVNPIQRIYVYMNYGTTIDLRGIYLGGGRPNPTAILYCTDQDSVAYFTKSLNKDTYDAIIAHGSIIPRVQNIFIRLEDEFGNLLNTNNRSVTFLLEITVVET
jgi:hypothetical protein